MSPDAAESSSGPASPLAPTSPPAPPPLVADSLDVSLTTADLARSREWYCTVLGFAVDREFQREGALIAVRLRADAVRLLITQDDGAKGAGRAKGEGFSLQLTTRQDIEAIAAVAKRAGATLDMEPVVMWGAHAFRLRDPDGFRWTISSPRAG